MFNSFIPINNYKLYTGRYPKNLRDSFSKLIYGSIFTVTVIKHYFSTFNRCNANFKRHLF